MPSCTDQDVAVAHNTAKQITLGCADPDEGDTLAYQVTSPPAHGTLSEPDSAGKLTYTPQEGYSGSDTFTFKASDDKGADSNAATVSLTVAPARTTPPRTDSGTGGGGGAGGGGGGAAPAPFAGTPGPTSAPLISGLRLSPARFAAEPSGSSAKSAAKKKKRNKKRQGTIVSYNLSQAATVVFAVERRDKGVKVKRGRKTTRARQTKRNRRQRRCARYTLAGTFSHSGSAGANRFHFSGRVGGKKLKPGSYRLTATPRGGARESPAKATFRVVR